VVSNLVDQAWLLDGDQVEPFRSRLGAGSHDGDDTLTRPRLTSAIASRTRA
jgi:hypothetical protein